METKRQARVAADQPEAGRQPDVLPIDNLPRPQAQGNTAQTEPCLLPSGAECPVWRTLWAVLGDARLGAASKLLFVFLWFLNRGRPGELLLSPSRLATLLGRDRRRLFDWLANLEKLGLVEVLERERKRGTVRLLLFAPAPAVLRSESGSDCAQRFLFSADGSTEGAAVLTPEPPRPGPAAVTAPKPPREETSYARTRAFDNFTLEDSSLGLDLTLTTTEGVKRVLLLAKQIVSVALGKGTTPADPREREFVIAVALVAVWKGWQDWALGAAETTRREVAARRHTAEPIRKPCAYFRRVLAHDLCEHWAKAETKAKGRKLLDRLLQTVRPKARQIEQRTRPKRPAEASAERIVPLRQATLEDLAAGRQVVAAAREALRACRVGKETGKDASHG